MKKCIYVKKLKIKYRCIFFWFWKICEVRECFEIEENKKIGVCNWLKYDIIS